MGAGDSRDFDLDQRQSRSAILVLGMHRSGTSVLTGGLGLYGAWVGEEAELTGRNVENPYGFWERRDVRQVCDGLLYAAGADWWKVASFDTAAIPHAILAHQRRRFEKVIALLNRHDAWVIKEPRLCLLLPVLADFLTDSVCIHVVRNPLEVARSLQVRNGFSIPAGIALWEVYNRRALAASRHLSRIVVSYESLMQRPLETFDALITRLTDSHGIKLVGAEPCRITDFVNPSFYHCRATEEETSQYLTSPQNVLWQQLRSSQIGEHADGEPLSSVTRQHLFDLESTQGSLIHYKNIENELRENTIKLDDELKHRDNRIDDLNRQIHDYAETIRNRDRKIQNLHDSNSWKITAPLRFLPETCRRIASSIRRVATFVYWLGTGQFPKAIRAALPYYEKYVPRTVDRSIPGFVRDYAKLAISVSHESSEGGADQVSPSRLRERIKEAERAFQGCEYPAALERWTQLRFRFLNDEAISGRAKLEISVINRLQNVENYKSRIQDYIASRERDSAQKAKVVVYTAIVQEYDSVKLPDHLDPEFDYVLFSDSKVPDTGIWDVRPITYFGSDGTRTARFVKTHPHILLSGYDVAIWMDSNIMILDDISDLVSGFLSSGKLIGCVPHPSRTSIYEEFAACKSKGKDEPETMNMQMDGYRQEHFFHNDLIESNFLMFDLNHGRTVEFLNRWWREIDTHSKRDQLSINYSLSKVDEDWYRVTNRPNCIRNDEKFAFVPHDGGIGSCMRLVEELGAEIVNPYDGRAYSEMKNARITNEAHRTVDIIVCVHNALEHVRQCLESVQTMRTNSQHRLIVVDDGSNSDTAEYLGSFCGTVPDCLVLRNAEAKGYPKAANWGLTESTGEFVILLNSDTIVTTDWVEKLADALFSTTGAGIVGPLSNAASYQSIPEYKGTGDQTAVNKLPKGLAPGDMNRHCENWTRGAVLPRVPLIHGFCFGIRREVIEQIGYFDVEKYASGYGEENDYCFRATDAGFGLVVATHTYVFHAKSKSYTEERRALLAKSASRTFRGTYGYARVKRAEEAMADNPILVDFRGRAGKLTFTQ